MTYQYSCTGVGCYAPIIKAEKLSDYDMRMLKCPNCLMIEAGRLNQRILQLEHELKKIKSLPYTGFETYPDSYCIHVNVPKTVKGTVAGTLGDITDQLK